jgi:cytochrome c
MRRILIAALFASAAALAAPAFAQPTKPAPAAAAAPAVDGKKIFLQCATCHTITKGGKDMTGPNLNGVFGRKAGTKAGYTYSAAMKAYGVTWSEQTLDVYLAAPQKVVKGTKMAFVGLPKPEQRKALIAYLKTETAK